MAWKKSSCASPEAIRSDHAQTPPMPFLPIMDRELRVAARRPATNWIRFFASLTVILVWVALLASNRRMGTAELSRALFTAVGVIALAFALFSGVLLTADCLSEEKREGTLGLLFLTDLKGYDVVLGKMAATSVHAFYGLLAILPVLGLPLLMGGVTGGEFWRVALVLVTTLLLSLSLGMFCSTLAYEARQAMSLSFLGLLLLGGVLPAFWWLGFVILQKSRLGLALWVSPVHTYRAAFDFCYRTVSGPGEFWGSLVTVLVLAIVFLALSMGLLPRAWREGKRTAQSKAERSDESPRLFQNSPIMNFFRLRNQNGPRVPLREQNPFYWLANRDRSLGRFAWKLVWLLGFVWLCAFLTSLAASTAGRTREAFILCLFTAFALHLVVKLIIGLEATRQLNTDRRSGALELLLVTPLPEREILVGQARALRHKFKSLLLVLAAVNIALCAAVFLGGHQLSMNATDRAIFTELFAGGLIVLWLDFQALSRVGMWMGLRATRHHRAAGATLGLVLLPPWVGVFLMVFLFQSHNVSASGAASIFAVWFLISIVVDVVVGATANERVWWYLRRRRPVCQPPLQMPTARFAPTGETMA